MGHCQVGCYTSSSSIPSPTLSRFDCSSFCTGKQVSVANTTSYSQFQYSQFRVSAGDFFFFFLWNSHSILYFLPVDGQLVFELPSDTRSSCSCLSPASSKKGSMKRCIGGFGTGCAGEAIKRHHNIKIGLSPSYIHKEIFSLIGGPLKCRPLMKM